MQCLLLSTRVHVILLRPHMHATTFLQCSFILEVR